MLTAISSLRSKALKSKKTAPSFYDFPLCLSEFSEMGEIYEKNPKICDALHTKRRATGPEKINNGEKERT